jgi:hypothetical protein
MRPGWLIQQKPEFFQHQSQPGRLLVRLHHLRCADGDAQGAHTTACEFHRLAELAPA